MIVLDASAILDYALENEPMVEKLRRRLIDAKETLHAPHLVDPEVANGLRRLVHLQKLTPHRAESALDVLEELDMTRYPHVHLLGRIWQLRERLTAYDAAYVALAEALDAPLVTTDSALGRSSGHRAQIICFQ